jgi:uncharacterized protein YndB with AHSA1/START domain
MTNSAESPDTLVVERVFPYPPQKLWRALTFEPVPGRKFQFRAQPVPQWDGIIDCEVLVVNPLKQLSYRWGTMGMGTVVLWTLTEADGGTNVRMEQSGFGPARGANYQGAAYGWNKFFGNLERVVAEVD